MNDYIKILKFFNENKFDDDFIIDFIKEVKEEYIKNELEQLEVQDRIKQLNDVEHKIEQKESDICPKCDKKNSRCRCVVN